LAARGSEQCASGHPAVQAKTNRDFLIRCFPNPKFDNQGAVLEGGCAKSTQHTRLKDGDLRYVSIDLKRKTYLGALRVQRKPAGVASEDAAAAHRIAEALRSAGVEVWFDQDELRGGDAWDQKIRRQIRECALFSLVCRAGKATGFPSLAGNAI
jgi:TIR domain